MKDLLHRSKTIPAIALLVAGMAVGLGLSAMEDKGEQEPANEAAVVLSIEDGIGEALTVDSSVKTTEEKLAEVRTAAIQTEPSGGQAYSYLTQLLEFGKTYAPGERALTTEESFLMLYKVEYVKQNLKGTAFEYANFLDVYLRDRLLAKEDGFTDADFLLYIDDYLAMHGESRM